jgi:glycosyltransferase involved in cell wall biosynthesis
MRVVIATIARPEGRTGVHTHFRTLLRYLRERGDEVTLVTPLSRSKLAAKLVFGARKVLGRLGPSVDVWWYERWHYAFLERALKRELVDGVPAVVYAQSPLAALAALRSRSGAQQTVVMAVHFNVSQAEEWATQVGLPRGGRVYRSIKRREAEVLPAVDGLVYVSEFVRQAVASEIPAAEGVRSAVLPNFVSPAGEDEHPAFMGDLVNVGTLEPRKNQAFLLQMLAQARDMGRTYSLMLIGDGPDKRGLIALAERLGLASQVRFAGYRSDARQLVAAHRVYVHAARMEASGVALIEAMAAARPVCAAPVGGIAEAYTDGVEGIFWDLEDPGEAAKKLIWLMETPGVLEQMSGAAKARYEAVYATERVAGSLVAFLRHEAPEPVEASAETVNAV